MAQNKGALFCQIDYKRAKEAMRQGVWVLFQRNLFVRGSGNPDKG